MGLLWGIELVRDKKNQGKGYRRSRKSNVRMFKMGP
jgi:hypothetical protein